MCSSKARKTLVQCDFDGTITEKDVSFLFLDTYANEDWRPLLEEYKAGKISVGDFNTRAFAMVSADKQTLLDLVFKSGKVRIRPGFNELLNYCSQNGLEFVIVSNGLIFYIEAILEDLGVKGIKVFAAQSWFHTNKGMEVKYIGPDGNQVKNGFKEVHSELFLKEGYRIVYVGNGVSDSYPARRAEHVFATGDLLDCCHEQNLNCTAFNDLNDVVRGLEQLSLG